MRAGKFVIWTILPPLLMVGGICAQTITGSSGNSLATKNNFNNNLTISEAASEISIPHSGYGYSPSTKKTISSDEKDELIYTYRKPAIANYARIIKVASITFHSNPKNYQNRVSSKIMIGLNNPSYGFKPDLNMAGNFDLAAENFFFGITNSVKMTISYNFKKALKSKKTSAVIDMSKIFIQVGVPFGKKG